MSSFRRPFALSVALLLGGVTALAASAPASAAAPAAAAPASAVDVRDRVAVPGSVALDAASAGKPFPGLTAVQIRARAAATMKSAPYFRATGFEKLSSGRIDIDVYVGQKEAVGYFKTAAGEEIGIRIGNTIYWQYSKQVIEAEKFPAELEGKWIRVTSGSTREWGLAIFALSPTGWSKWVNSQPVSRRAAGSKFTGTPTVRLDVVGPKGGSLYIASTGRAYPRYVKSFSGGLQYAFHEYGKAFTVDAPNEDEIIDLPSA